MSNKSATDSGLVLFSEKLANSAAFATLFREGTRPGQKPLSFLPVPSHCWPEACLVSWIRMNGC